MLNDGGHHEEDALGTWQTHWNDSAINVFRQAEQALDARCCGFGPHADYH